MSADTGSPADSARPLEPRSGWWRWAVVVAYLGLIFFLSSQSSLPSLPGRISDKVQHFTAYGILSALVVWAVTDGFRRRVTWQVVLLATLTGLVYGFSDEVHQRFVPGRQYDLHDLAADVLGAFTVAAALWAWGIISRGSTETHDA